jgi:hypothetical protein
MENQKLLFSKNKTNRGRGSFRRNITSYIIEIEDRELNNYCINKIIMNVNYYIDKYSRIRLPLIILFNNEIKIIDKLTYIFLECICFYLINDLDIEVHISWKPQMDIITEGLNSSPLLLLSDRSKENVKKYVDKFKNDGYGSHYRRLVENSAENLCSVYQDVDSFFKIFYSCDSIKDKIAEIIAELVGNAFEHGCSDCLIDIDVANNYNTIIDNLKYDVYSVNLAVISFSSKLIGDELKQRLQKNNMIGERNEQLLKAFNNHRKYLFDEEYEEEDFYNIAVFQDSISGVDKGAVGGKGLTVLIKSLQQMSYENHCYMLSGNRAVSLKKEYLLYDDDNWIGFNREKDFFCIKPANGVISKCVTFMPGTAYNLDFIMIKGERNE